MQQLQTLLALVREGSPAVKALLGAGQAATAPPSAAAAPLPPAPSKVGASKTLGASGQQKETGSDGWVPDKAKAKGMQAKQKSCTGQPTQREELLSKSSAKVVSSTKELAVTEPCVCLATMAEGRRAVEELKSQKPMAVLVPARLDGRGVETQVFVKDSRGEKQTRTRFLVQIGQGEVTFDHSCVAYGKEVGQVNKKVVIYGVNGKCPKEVWKSLADNPKSAVDKWLKTIAGLTEAGHLSKPRLADEVLQVVAEVPPGAVDKAIASSGQCGLFAREFVENGETGQLSKVPLPIEHDRAAALRIAASLGDKARGVVPTKKGWTVQVWSAHFQDVAHEVNPDRAALWAGAKYEVSGLPLSWNKDNVTSFLSGWGAEPVGRSTRVGFQHTWTVRAERPPPADEIRNPDSLGLNVLALVKSKVHKPRKPKQVLTWSRKPVSGKQTALGNSWSAVVRGATSSPTAVNTSAGVPRVDATDTPATKGNTSPVQQMPCDFMAELRKMIHAAVAPLQAEIMQMKKVMDEDLEDHEEADAEESEDEEEKQETAAVERDSARAASRPAEPSGEPPSRRKGENSRSPRRG